MLDAVIGLPIISIVTAFLGCGWASLLPGLPSDGQLGLLFRSWLCCLAASSFIWAWVYPLNGSVTVAGIAFTAFCALGHVIAWRRHIHAGRSLFQSRALSGLVIPLAVTLIALTPAMAGLTRLSVGQRIGPDEIGYAIPAAGLARGETKSVIQRALVEEVGSGTASEAVSPSSKAVDAIPSFTVQVENEFLTGADRWAFSGTVALGVTVAGASHLWSMLSLLAGFSLLVAATGIWVAVRTEGGRLSAALSVVLLGLGCSLLNSWHEGALAGVWVVPFLISIAIGLGFLDSIAPRDAAIAIGIGVIGILPAYNDAAITYGVVIGLTCLLSIPILRRLWWPAWSTILLGLLCAAIACAPSSIDFVVNIARSLQENTAAGWPQPRWPSLAEAFGIGNPYGSALPAPIPRSTADLSLDGAADVAVAALIALAVVRCIRSTRASLLIAVLTTGLAVYLKTRYIDHSTSYQYFKTIAMLAPAGALAFGLMIADLTRVESRETRIRRSSRRMVTPVGFAMLVGVVASGIGYVLTYRSLGDVVPSEFTSLASSHRGSDTFEQYNVIMPLFSSPLSFYEERLTTMAIGAEVNLNWMGRNNGGPPQTRLQGRTRNPLAFLVLEKYCPHYFCLSAMKPVDIAYEGQGIALVRLGSTSEPLTGLPDHEWPYWASKRFEQLGGRAFSGLL